VRLRGAYLDAALSWEKKESPNAAWAARYGADEARYRRAIQFLRSSHRWLLIRRLLLAVLVAGVAAIAVVFYVLYDRANQQKRTADSLRLVAISQVYRETRPDLSMLLSVEAYQFTHTFEARSALLAGLEGTPGLLALLHHEDPVSCVTFSPDGKTLASASDDHTVRLWDVATRQLLGKPLEGHTAAVTSVAFSRDGKTLASASEDNAVRLWDVATRQPLGKPLEGHTDYVRSVTFSPDGKTLASASDDHTVRLWDVATRQPLGKPLEGQADSVTSIAYSP
jgi:WD40 repeat protein